ncbi:MAG: thiamine pyrophosphate-dependent enzyme [Desulfohalobiaceae bacterium]
MSGLLNKERPPVFCPGCSHDNVVRSLDRALQNMGLAGNQVVLVSDIGCSGLFDTFFHTHALHGLHGRALTYAAGIKLARPEAQVIVTMGDGGLGIGGAHLLAACRRNLNLTLLVLNNFNFGMTGGQFSVTTPPESLVGSGFLNNLEQPMDICSVADSAGAPYVARWSAYTKGLSDQLQQAVEYDGFSLLDIWGICTGRYKKQNTISPKQIDQEITDLPAYNGRIPTNERTEYAESYASERASRSGDSLPVAIEPRFTAPEEERVEAVLLGAAGQRVVTAGELLCLAAMTAGHQATQKNDYPITVLTGHSVSETILSPETIAYTGITRPSVVVALAEDGVKRRKKLFGKLSQETLVLKVPGLEIPQTEATVKEIDFKAMGIKEPNWALAALAALAGMNRVLSRQMLETAIGLRFREKLQEPALEVVDTVIRGQKTED